MRNVLLQPLACIAVSLPLLSLAVASDLGTNTAKSTTQYGSQAVDYVGSHDQLSIWAFEVDEITNKAYRVDSAGNIDLPLLGVVKAAGRTTDDIKADLTERLRKYVREPKVTVTLAEGRSKPVTVLGAVNTPGVHQAVGHKTLLEMISLSGGLRPDAGYAVKITRDSRWGDIPLEGAAKDSTGRFSVAEVRTADLIEATDPRANIEIYPNDVVSVPKGEMIYIIGDVRKPGGFILGEKRNMPILQALSLSEGPLSTASFSKSRIVRPGKGTGQPTEIPVDLKKILSGREENIALQANDILYVPTSNAKKITARAIEASISLGTGVLIWRR